MVEECVGAKQCFDLGNRYLVGEGVRSDLCRAADLYELACSDGHQIACVRVARLGVAGKCDLGDEVAAILLRDACVSRNGEGCFQLGEMERFGTGTAANPPFAALLYRQACNLGEPVACQSLGNMYYLGDGIHQDLERAAVLFQQLCRDGVAPTCASLAFMYEHGRGVPRNPQRARSLYRIACDTGHPLACGQLERMSLAP